MNILQIISSVDPAAGGPIEGVWQLGSALASMGDQIEVLSLDPPDAPYLKQTPLPVYALGPARFGYAFSPHLVPWLRSNRRRYDVVVVNGLWQFHSFGAWRALRDSTTPYVLYTHGMLDPWFKKQFPLKHLKKWMYWPWAEYRVLRDAQAVLFTSEEERVLARRSFWLYRCREIVVGFGTSRPACSLQLAQKEFFDCYPELRGKRLVLFLGRIHPKKGCDLLIEAFAKVMARHADWHLIIAGPDQVGWQKKLKERAGRLGLASRITWPGMIGGPLKWGALQAAEIFMLPSHQENFGVAVVEALSVGVPTLISNKVNIWREIASDGAGIVAEDSFEGTCELMRSYFEMPEEKKQNMRRAAFSCFAQRFEVNKAADRLHAVLVSLVGVRRAAKDERHSSREHGRVPEAQIRSGSLP